MTESTTARMIADAIEASGKTQREIATEICYERPNVVSMMNTGVMRLPLERVPAFAASTGIDAELLLRTAMLEYMPETWNVVARSKRDTGAERAFPQLEAQIKVRGAADQVERFKRLCQRERRTYFDMLVQLMDIRDAGSTRSSTRFDGAGGAKLPLQPRMPLRSPEWAHREAARLLQDMPLGAKRRSAERMSGGFGVYTARPE